MLFDDVGVVGLVCNFLRTEQAGFFLDCKISVQGVFLCACLCSFENSMALILTGDVWVTLCLRTVLAPSMGVLLTLKWEASLVSVENVLLFKVKCP